MLDLCCPAGRCSWGHCGGGCERHILWERKGKYGISCCRKGLGKKPAKKKKKVLTSGKTSGILI